MHILCLLVLGAVASVAVGQDCKPFGVRLSFGRSFTNKLSNQKLAIRFNTRSACPKSFITVQKNSSSISKLYCDNFRLQFDSYVTFVQKCYIVDIKQGQGIQYMAFGWTGNAADSQVSFRNQLIPYYFPRQNDQFKMINLADWGFLRQLKDKYKSLDDSFRHLVSIDKNIRAIFVNGDSAYDLQSNNGRNYEDFLTMISQVTINWALIINAGNHQHRDKNLYILNSSFETYGLTDNNLTQLRLPWFNFVVFDPFDILYNKRPQELSFPNFQRQLNDAYSSNMLTIVASHYPFRCNGIPSDCITKHENIDKFFTKMYDANVPVYLGAHHHAYQRHYPFKADGSYQKIQRTIWSVQSRYEQRKLISIVQGIGGNDVGIQQKSYQQIQDFTASNSYNVTGFGLLKIDKYSVAYSHYTTNNIYRPMDEVQIILRRAFRKHLRTE